MLGAPSIFAASHLGIREDMARDDGEEKFEVAPEKGDESTPYPDPRSQRRKNHHHHHHHHHDRHRAGLSSQLPYGAKRLNRSHEIKVPIGLDVFELYMVIKEDLNPQDMEDDEWQKFWRKFVGKWNSNSLDKSWYRPDAMDPRTGIKTEGRPERGVDLFRALFDETRARADGAGNAANGTAAVEGNEEADMTDGESDDYGPAPPPSALAETTAGNRNPSTQKHGAGVPSLQDLQARQELAMEEAQRRISDLKQDRKADRALQRERLDEVLPRAEAGTRERQLEKKKLVNEKMRSFRERSPGAAEVNDSELMGGADERAEYKQRLAAQERWKTEREVRREEFERARRAELEERRAEMRNREEERMKDLKALAKQRFG
jgi:hypothetical protein